MRLPNAFFPRIGKSMRLLNAFFPRIGKSMRLLNAFFPRIGKSMRLLNAFPAQSTQAHPPAARGLHPGRHLC